MFALRALTVSSAFLGATLLLPAQGVFRGEDVNRDGIISRDEWRGNDRSFEGQDTNGDGILSGNELPASMRRGNSNSDTRSRDGNRSRAAATRLDKDRSGAVEGYEWPYEAQIFRDLDKNEDSVLTRDELQNLNSVALGKIDSNNDGRVGSDEWPGGFAQFERLDEDNDGRVSSKEYFGRGGDWQRRQRFDAWDSNRDGRIQSTEWKSNANLFRQLDTDRDSTVSRDEFMADTGRYVKPYGWR
jgi:Ca2+-binding EF-hand superfamily protein